MTSSENAALDLIALNADTRQGEMMCRKVYNYLGRFVVYPSDHARIAHALWCIHTHMMDRWESTPRFAALSPEPASGKTRLLEVTEPLVPSPVSAVNVSPAYLFRKVGQEEDVTILFDEIDTVFGPKVKENEELRGLLNAGHRRGAVAGRCVVRGKTIETEEISAYAAVALAGLGWLPDTILSRSIVVRMRRRHQGERVEQFRHRIHAPQGHVVRQSIEVWAATQPCEIESWPELPPEIQDRDADVWEPLIAIADLVGGDWPLLARQAAIELVKASKETELSLGIRLLADIKAVFDGNPATMVMATVSVLEKLAAMEEAPWGDLKGKPLDSRGLAKRLREYGIKPKLVRTGEPVRGYARADFADAWARYLPSPPAKSVSGVAPVTNPRFGRDGATNAVTDVTDVTHLPGKGGGRAPPLGPPAISSGPDLDIPRFLRRTSSKQEESNAPALGPPGDSLDDFK